MVGPGLFRQSLAGAPDANTVVWVFLPVVIGLLIGLWIDKECQKPSGVRFRFSLRKMLILVTVLIVPMAWLSSEVRNIRYRAAMLDRLKAAGGSFYAISYREARQRQPYTDKHGRIVKFRFWRPWLGDQIVVGVVVPDGYPPDDLSEFWECFPEAQQTMPVQVQRLP